MPVSVCVFPKPGEDMPLPKIAYAERFAAWDWTVATGIYLDEMQAQNRQPPQLPKQQSKGVIKHG